MRCMGCGEDMVVTATASDDAALPAGFMHEILQCLACGDIERRLVFNPALIKTNAPTSARVEQPVFPASQPPETASSSPSAPSPVSDASSSLSLPSEIRASAPAWTRAVEKLRSRQADIRVRTQKQKPDWHSRFNEAWEKLAPPARGSGTNNANLRAPEQSVWKSARALRAELRSALASDAAARPAIKPPPEVLERFNQFWDGLLPGRDRSAPPAEVASTGPLPPSLSLVLREHPQGASTAARAIMLLRGANVPG
jgi:hypothetical protein